MTHNELIKALEAATGPSRELDAEIWWTVERKTAERTYWSAATGLPRKLPDNSPIPGGLGSTAVKVLSPPYTQSIDAALTMPSDGMWSTRLDAAMTMLEDLPPERQTRDQLARCICIIELKART